MCGLDELRGLFSSYFDLLRQFAELGLPVFLNSPDKVADFFKILFHGPKLLVDQAFFGFDFLGGLISLAIKALAGQLQKLFSGPRKRL